MGSLVDVNQAIESVGLSVLSLLSFAVIITEVVPIVYSPSSTQQDLTDREEETELPLQQFANGWQCSVQGF